MDRKDDMDLESLKNMLSDVPDTDEFDLDSIIAEVSGQAPAKAAEPMPKAEAEPEKPVEPQPAPAAETKAEEPQTAYPSMLTPHAEAFCAIISNAVFTSSSGAG